MPAIVKNLLAIILGLVVGGCVNMLIVTIGPLVIPPPEGVDMSDMEKFADNLLLLQPVNFIAPWLAHAVGTLVGAFIAVKLAENSRLAIAMGIGVFFLLGGISMVAFFGGPAWFAVIDLLGAYLPMAYLGYMLGHEKPVATTE